MKRHSLITLTLAAAVGVFAAAAIAQPEAPLVQGQIAPPGSIDCEPVLFYDVTGGTLAGAVHMHLAVYSDGMSSISSSVEVAGLTRMEVETLYVPPGRVTRLIEELVAAGALDMRDRVDGVADLPLQTLTVIADDLAFFGDRGEFADPETTMNSFNFYLPIPEISPILDRFIDENF